MSGVEMVPVGQLMVSRGGSVNPSQFLDEDFDLYSIPAFDAGAPEIAKGADIGSTKQIVRPNDVLLSKIVPHIRRAWVVGPERGRRLIGSGEWIVFRSDRVHAPYLRHVLVGDPFHEQFMQTVSGVGGSLLRARPAFVAGISIPLPPLQEQRHIAAILDQAETLRPQRRAALAQLDSLTQSLFLDMFGEQTTYARERLDGVCDLITDGTHYTPTYAADGVVFLSAKNVTSGYIDWGQIKYIPEELHKELHKRVAPQIGDVLMAKNGTTGIAAIVDRDCVFDIYVSLALLRPKPHVLTAYLHAALNSPLSKKQFNAALKGIGVPNLHLKDIRGAVIPIPPLPLQQTFATRVQAIEALKAQHRAALAEQDALFASLQQRAFAGNL